MDKTRVVLRKKPLILKKSDLKILNSSLMPTNVAFFREEVLHDTKDVYFLKGEYQRLLVVNRFNVVNKSSRTIARYFKRDGSVFEKTSDRVTQVIGQEHYKTLFTALCSIIDQELRIRSILAILTVKTADSKLELVENSTTKQCEEKSCQTDEIRISVKKPRKRIRKQVGPYIIQDLKPSKKKAKKLIVNIPANLTESENCKFSVETNSIDLLGDFKNNSDTDSESERTIASSSCPEKIQRKCKSVESLQDLGFLDDEFSNHSEGKLSALSDTTTIPEILTNPQSFFNNIDDCTKEFQIQEFIVQQSQGTDIQVPYKPADIFHIATKENLLSLNMQSRMKLLQHQMNIDKKYCLTVLEDGNYLIHLAVLNNDIELLARQCIVLKMCGSSVDIASTNGLTPLKLALFTDAPASSALAALILQHGANPLLADGAHRAAAHHAAERDSDTLRAVMKESQENARRILSDSEELWSTEMEMKADDELAAVLMKHMCSMYDKQGYTPLMLASMLGLYENVRILLEHSPSAVNDRMPTSGNTALYLAIAAAINSSAESGNKSKLVDHFRKTVEVLLENGADLTIDNHSGNNTNSLLQESECTELCSLVSQKMTERMTKNKIIAEKFPQLMLIKDKEGNVEFTKLENNRQKKPNSPIDYKKEKNKPVIVQNIVLNPTAKAKATSSDEKRETRMVSTKNRVESTKNRVESTKINKPKYIVIPNNLKRKITEERKMMKFAKVDK